MGGAAAALAGAPGSTAGAATRKRPYRERDRVDVHAHYLAPVYRQKLADKGINAIGGIPIPDWSPELAKEFMAQHDIQIQMLSVSDPGVAFLPAGEAAELARASNDYVAGVVKVEPNRFGAFAVVPLQDVSAAREEIKRSLDVLKLDGVGLLSSSEGRYLGDPAFAPLLAELHARRAWVFVHPTAVAAVDKPSYSIPDFIAEYPFDTTRAIISLLFNGAFARYPNIRWHFAHAGGTVPMLRVRLTALAAAAPVFGPLLGLPEDSSVLNEKSTDRAFKRSYFDTALVADPPSLRAAQGIAGDKRVVFGSDWPFASRLYSPDQRDPQPALSQVFTNTERHAVDRLNARAQFKRLRSFVPKG